ncbi:MAG: ABC transporter ATP-binding protein [Bacteroidota bacterium]
MGIRQRPVILKGEALHKSYETGKTVSVHVLKGVDIEVRKGELLAIIGPSGSGKSTLLHILGGLDRPTSGSVSVNDTRISSLPDERLAEFRNTQLGFVFQFHHLLPEFTALENVAMPALIQGSAFPAVRERAEKLLAEVGLAERVDHRPTELSGGEQQRVAVARAFMNSPQIILADEPSGNLDEHNGTRLHELLVEFAEKRGQTIIVATHNNDLIRRAHRVLQLVEGRLVTGIRATM